MADIIQLRRDTASNWTNANPTLASGELGMETDTTKLKLGNGSTAWTSLGYYTLATTGFAPLANPTFTGTVTGPTINASTALQVGGAAITSTPAELNVLDGIPAGLTATELGYVDGVTSAIQTQLNTKGTVSSLSDLSITSTATELNLLDGLTDIGYKNVPQNSQSANYTCVLTDSGKHIHHPSSDANARTYTIPANSSVAYPIGTAITFTNLTSQAITIAITSDTMYLAKEGTTGNRTLAQYGMATALKTDSTKWIISGNGLT